MLYWNGLPVGIVQTVKWESDRQGSSRAIYETIDITRPTKAIVFSGVANAVFGVPGHKKPYRGNLVGNIRIKYRIDDFARIYVRDPYRIREYLLVDEGDHVTHGMETAQTQRTTPRKA